MHGQRTLELSYLHQQKLRVIGAGFGRSGTTSLRAALRRLGYEPRQIMWPCQITRLLLLLAAERAVK